MDNFQKRALAYNAYRALRKAASNGSLIDLLKYAELNKASNPAESVDRPTRRSGFSRSFLRGANKSKRKSNRGCCK